MSYLKNGWRIDRNADGSVTISVHVRGSSGHVTEVHHLTLSASEWCSVVALVSATGKSAKPTLETIHNGTQVQRAETSTRTTPSPRVPNDQGGKTPGKARPTAGEKGKSSKAATPDSGGKAKPEKTAPAESETVSNGDETTAV